MNGAGRVGWRPVGRTLRRAALAFLLALFSMGVAGTGFAGGPVGRVPGADPAVAGVPEALAKAGWVPSEPLRAFSPVNLYEEIDGEAELYLPYDFRALTVAILKNASRPGVELRLETYRHGTPKDAFGIFSQYRYPEQETVRVGPSEATVSDASLDFFRGDSFVRIRVASGALSREALLAAARATVEATSGAATPQPGAAVVAIPAAVKGTVIYQKKAMLGYEPLAPGYEARFAEGVLSGKVIYLDGADAGPGDRDRLAKALPGFRETAAGECSATLPQGALYLRAAGNGTVGVLGKLSREQAAPILAALSRNAGVLAGKAPANR